MKHSPASYLPGNVRRERIGSGSTSMVEQLLSATLWEPPAHGLLLFSCTNWSVGAAATACRPCVKAAVWPMARSLKGFSSMLNFAPTEEQEEIRRLAHSVAVEELRTSGRSSEKRGDISLELMYTLAQTGLTTPFPEAYGGSGSIEAVTYTLIAEELAFGDGGLAMNVIGSLAGPLTVLLAGDESQQEYYIAPFCDERDGAMKRGSLAFAERIGGYTLGEISAIVREEDGSYILNGTKRDVIHGGQSSPQVVLARLEGTTGADGLCALMVPTETKGLRISNDVQKLGLIAAPSASYILDNVTVPATCMPGKPGN